MQQRDRQIGKRQKRTRASKNKRPSLNVPELLSLANEGTILSAQSPASKLSSQQERLQKSKMKHLAKMLNQIICENQQVGRKKLFEVFKAEYDKYYNQTQQPCNCRRRFRQILRVMKGINMVSISRTLVYRQNKTPLKELLELRQRKKEATERINRKRNKSTNLQQSIKIIKAHLKLNNIKGVASDKEKVASPLFIFAYQNPNNQRQLTLCQETLDEQDHKIEIRGRIQSQSKKDYMLSLHSLYPQGIRDKLFSQLGL